jgi:uncharacterized membrane protein YgdD (TMEM256/DUF423 family)
MSTTQLKWLGLSGAVLAMVAVVIGAFAAHGLKAIIEPTAIEIIKTGVFYQFIHSLAILIITGLAMSKPFCQVQYLLWRSANLMVIGCLLFSGSLYGLALTQVSWFGPLTPMGGLAFIIAWLLLCVAVWRIHPDSEIINEKFNGK